MDQEVRKTGPDYANTQVFLIIGNWSNLKSNCILDDVEELGFWWDDGIIVLFLKRSLCLFETHAEVSMGEMM